VEWRVPATPDVVRVTDLPPSAPMTTTRGAAHEAYTRLFELPFDPKAAAAYRFPAPEEALAMASPPPGVLRRAAPWTVGASAALAVGGGITALLAHGASAPPGASQAEVAGTNERIRTLNTTSVVLLSGAAAAAITAGLMVWFGAEQAP